MGKTVKLKTIYIKMGAASKVFYIFNFIRRDQNDSSKTIIRKKTT